MEKKIAYECRHAEEISGEDASLLLHASRAADAAYAPYSGFAVGAAVLLGNGEVVSGSNQENAAFGAGTCAERVALYSAASIFPDASVKAIAIAGAGKHRLSPCGVCRQVLAEFEFRQKEPIRILFFWNEGHVISLTGIDALLPFAFSSGSLKL